ncbi:hypothetical protein GGI43DRAFT_430508 [Trichoderma evansii]
MAQLVPPSSEERDLYYFGLPSCPKLVARSSSIIDPWVNPQMPGPTTFTGTMNMYPKSFLPAGDNTLLRQLWNDATSSLRIQIMEAVSVADWTSINILRVGLKEDFHNTLLIAVAPNSMPWREGHSLALRCKTILEEHGITDMHCEIRESIATLCADAPTADTSSAPATAPDDFQLSSEPIDSSYPAYCAELSDSLGMKIAMKDLDYVVGTKGLYLALPLSTPESERRIVALTCRHVVISSQTEGLQEYRHQHSQPYKEVIQVDQPTYKRMIESLEAEAKDYRDWADGATQQGRTRTATNHTRLAIETENLAKSMVRYATPFSRVFGRLLYSPEFICKSENGSQWLRDWALIELLPSRHQAQLSSLRNKVYVGPRQTLNRLIRESERGWAGLPPPPENLEVEDGTITLTRVVVPKSELIRPPHFTDYSDERAILVAKYGARGGLTLGLGNTLTSVVRYTDTLTGQRQTPSEEWCITSATATHNRQVAFSEPGDSGSCIWDINKRVAGILGGGDGINQLNDITYAQPLERLLEDIRSHGFDVSLI